MKTFLAASITLLLLSGCSSREDQLARRAEKLHEDILSVVTHCDTPLSMVESDFDLGEKHDIGCVDFPRMKEGGLDAEFFAVFTGQGDRNDSAYNKVHGGS